MSNDHENKNDLWAPVLAAFGDCLKLKKEAPPYGSPLPANTTPLEAYKQGLTDGLEFAKQLAPEPSPVVRTSPTDPAREIMHELHDQRRGHAQAFDLARQIANDLANYDRATQAATSSIDKRLDMFARTLDTIAETLSEIEHRQMHPGTRKSRLRRMIGKAWRARWYWCAIVAGSATGTALAHWPQIMAALS